MSSNIINVIIVVGSLLDLCNLLLSFFITMELTINKMIKL